MVDEQGDPIPGVSVVSNDQSLKAVTRADGTFSITLPEGVEMVMPGDHSAMTVELQKPVGLHEGLRFALRDGGKTIGAGVVSKILDWGVC